MVGKALVGHINSAASAQLQVHSAIPGKLTRHIHNHACDTDKIASASAIGAASAGSWVTLARPKLTRIRFWSSGFSSTASVLLGLDEIMVPLALSNSLTRTFQQPGPDSLPLTRNSLIRKSLTRTHYP